MIRESMGQGRADPRRGRPRPRDHERGRARPLGRRQGRRRRPRRPDRRARQGRQPRHDDGVHPALVIGPVDRDPRRRRPDPHRRRDRLPRPLHLPADRRRGARVRDHDADRRRHRPGRGHEGDDRHAGRWHLAAHARRAGRLAGQRAAARQGQHRLARRRCASRCAPARAASSCTRTGARRRPRSTPACAVADETGVQVAIHTDTLNEAGFVESTLEAIAGRTIHAYHTEGAGGGHAPDIITVAVVPERAAVVDEPDAAAHGQHRRRAPRHADGLPPPQPARARGPRVRREPHPRRRRSRPRTCCTTSARSR